MRRISNWSLALVVAAFATVSVIGQGQGTRAGGAPAQAPGGGGQGGGGGRGGGFQLPVAPYPNRMPQGGNGPVKVLFISKGHFFDRDGLMTFFDQLGRDINWTHVEQPAAQVFYDQRNAA